jgi:hypothetical protein
MNLSSEWSFTLTRPICTEFFYDEFGLNDLIQL